MCITTISRGLDPTIGYLHACRPGRMAVVFSLMDPLRPRVDRFVRNFIRARTLASDDFVIDTHGLVEQIRNWRGMWHSDPH